MKRFGVHTKKKKLFEIKSSHVALITVIWVLSVHFTRYFLNIHVLYFL